MPHRSKPVARRMNVMTGRSPIPADRTHSPHRRSGARVWARVWALHAGVLLLAAAALPSLAVAQHNHAGGENPPRYSAAPAPHFQNPPYRPPAPRGGYLRPQQRFQSSPAQRPQSQTPPSRAPQPRSDTPHTAAPPAPTRPLITAQPFAPAPGTPRPAPPQPGTPQPGIPGQGFPRQGFSGRGLSGPTPSTQRTQFGPPPANLGRGNQQHLGGWLQSHSGQSFSTQEQSLRQEPGFSRLPQPQQQRLIDRLHQLDSMPPQRRERTLGRIENLERLTPDRRQQVRNSAQELSAMPEERRQQVRGAFRGLRDLPPEQRQQQLDSPAFRGQYSDHERQILGNLLSVEPYQSR